MLAALQNTVSRERSPDRDEQLAVEIRDIVDLLRIHIRKEEAVVLRVAERTLAPPELRRIARRFEDAEPPSERK
jgi:hemerythrin-like domain-containing protein